MNLKFWNKKPEPKTPSFRESVQMLAVLVAAVVASATAAYKAVVLVFEVAYATPAYIKAMFTCGGSFIATGWKWICAIPALPGKAFAWLKSLVPTRATTTDPAATTTTGTATTDPAATTTTGTATTDPAATTVGATA